MRKITPVFGPQELFDGYLNDVVCVSKNDGTGEIFQYTSIVIALRDLTRYKGGSDFTVAMRSIEEVPELHHDDSCVNAFAKIMKAKLSVCRDKGYSGWETCSIEHLNSLLLDSIKKGDPVDVANYAMMIRQRGHPIEAPKPKRWTAEDRKAGRLPEVDATCIKIGCTDEREILAVTNTHICIGCKDNHLQPYSVTHGEFIQYYQPVETPAEKALRLRGEWVDFAQDAWDKSGAKGGFLEFIYDLQASGKLPPAQAKEI